jgi:hypothetical protein
VSLTLTWPCRLCSEFSFVGASATGFPLSKHWERWHCTCLVRPACLFTVHVGGGSSPSPVQFSSHRCFHKLSCSWLLGGAAVPASHHVCLQFTWEVGLPSSPVEVSSLRHSHKLSRSWLLGACPSSLQSLSGLPGLFIYSPGKDSLPPIFGAQGTPPSFLRVLFVLIAYYSVSLFFPGWRSVCPGGYAALAQACLWEYRGTTNLTWFTSSQAIWAPATGGLGALLASPFNVKWRISAPAGGVEGSKLYLFSVIKPAKFVSSGSPRFHYRRLAFCFLPLAAIFSLLFFSLFIYFFISLKFLYYKFKIWRSPLFHWKSS